MTAAQDPQGLVEALLAALASEADADEAARQARVRSDKALEEARDSGLAWAELAQITGLSEGTLRWRRYNQAWSGPKRDSARSERTKRAKPPRGPRPSTGPGQSVAEFALEHDVSRKTVYQWIDKGWIETTESESKKVRVLGFTELGDERALGRADD